MQSGNYTQPDTSSSTLSKKKSGYKMEFNQGPDPQIYNKAVTRVKGAMHLPKLSTALQAIVAAMMLATAMANPIPDTDVIIPYVIVLEFPAQTAKESLECAPI
ncbi:hypothetical protein JR316_0010115 [Psilocybe cubensis]|uniref:Uncharacterized protein n=2 Tax=Psilocybe cubensis TaxID=181762 RepID=A0ACB8GQR9_PSICU|nr:hypothetical protein JR316_0010115 [Psilocybe cubensis]KAH9477883.1 hypothetical protein JR316_0010115 [Psilocybe cubensis]